MEQFIKDTIQKAGDEIMKFFGTAEIVKIKATTVDIVTEADLASEKIIIEAIKKAYPDHGIVSEESDDYNTSAEYVWYIDPLDGTKNFESRVQLFGINIALARNGILTHAAIYLPALNELCYAEKGKGVELNGKKVSCSAKKTWEGVFGLGAIKFSDKYMKLQAHLAKLSNESAWTNAISCSAVSGIWVASGRRDFYIGTGSNSWDYAAPALLAKEAGCIVTNFKGEDWKPGDKGLVIANPTLHPKFLEIVQDCYNS
jgi:myo-inositol-1(or 4)-monophosphatase